MPYKAATIFKKSFAQHPLETYYAEVPVLEAKEKWALEELTKYANYHDGGSGYHGSTKRRKTNWKDMEVSWQELIMHSVSLAQLLLGSHKSVLYTFFTLSPYLLTYVFFVLFSFKLSWTHNEAPMPHPMHESQVLLPTQGHHLSCAPFPLLIFSFFHLY